MTVGRTVVKLARREVKTSEDIVPPDFTLTVGETDACFGVREFEELVRIVNALVEG